MTLQTTPDLRIATRADIDDVARLVADAFDHLDVIHWLVSDPDRRKPISRDWYRLYVEHAIGGAGQVVTTSDGLGAAVWFDRTGEISDPDDYAKRLAELAGDHLPRFLHLDQQMEAHHPADPHWHLLFLAVHPSRWSQGYGSALMDYTHARLDADRLAAYLEATSPQNRRLYRRHGYTDMTPPAIDVTDTIPLFRMWRPPAPDQSPLS
ncbi:GNAT family N-acetyltransferase [Paractinoplanes globisporus]|uniref:GNAT family N-acetyltransferase n=1 Tax=Paractinoplanes globisporus TaxID=113565 RepID=A0ABW6WF22_9ACTN|nr:GNAT family N-acetyltransferase [Actinoplanes globisporus]